MRPFADYVRVMLVTAAAGLCLGGCGEEQDDGPPPVRPTTTAPAGTAAAGALGPSAGGGKGTIRGTVSLVGAAPEMRVIENKPCHPGATPIREETVVLSAEGRLANVVVFLREAPASAEAVPTAELDQVNCRFVPHVLALKTGQILRVKSSDPTLHNVHTLSEANRAWNLGFPQGAAPREVTFDQPEGFTLRCDVHQWMTARVHVFDHRHFAVTDAAGGFELPDVPAGRYTLIFRHELFGDIEQTIDVADGQTAKADGSYEKPR